MIIHTVEQNTPEWLSLRAGLPTASAFSKLVTSTGAPSKSINDYALLLANEKYAGCDLDGFEGNKHTERGHELEDDAAQWYGLIKDFPVDVIGFVTDDNKIMGCSPDRMSDNVMVEIKCLGAKAHTTALMYYKKHGKMPTAFIQQTQGQMMICEKERCDLVFYHPKLPKLIIRSEPDEKFLDSLLDQIHEVSNIRDEIYNTLLEF